MYFEFKTVQRIQQWQALFDGIDCVDRFTRMRGATFDSNLQINAAEATRPDAWRRATVEAENMALYQLLFSQITDAGVQTAFFVSTQQ